MCEADIVIPQATIDKIDTQVYDIFLIPKPVKPFEMRSSYLSKKKIFGCEMQKEFLENYKKIDRSEFYAVFIANRLLTNCDIIIKKK